MIWLRSEALFRDDPTALRRLVLVLYALVGPLFTAALFVVAARSQVEATAAVAALILAGGAWTAIRRSPKPVDFVFPAAVVPIVCCGIAFVASEPKGLAYLAVVMAPVAWASVLFEAPVVVAAVTVAIATIGVALVTVEDPLVDLANLLVFCAIATLVAWVGYQKSRALRKARARLQALMDALPDTVTRTDAEGHLLEVRAPVGQPLPMPAAELVGRTVFEFLPPSVREPMRQAIRAAMASGEPQRLTYTAPYPDGPRTFETRIVRSAPDELVVLRQEITGREAEGAQARLAASLISAMDDSVVTVGLDGLVTFWSDGAARLSGWTAEEAVGRPITAFVLPDLDEARARDLIAEIVRAGGWRETRRLVRKDRSALMVEATYSVLHDADGAPAGVLSVSRDVTPLQLAHERELDDARLHSLESRMNDAELVMTLDGAIVHANDRALALYGYSVEAIRHLNVRDLRAEEKVTDVPSQLATARVGGVRFETRHRRAGGTTFPVEVSIRSFKVGDGEYLHSLVRDLSEQEAAEAERIRLEAEVREALRERDMVLGTTPVGITRTRNRVQLWANRRMADLFGYTQSDMAEVSTRLFYADDEEYDRVGREAYPILRDGLVYVTEVRMRRSDGSVFTARMSGRAAGPGATADVIWVFEDVTARVEAEEARARAMHDLEDALANVRTLSGLLPICMYCKRIRNDEGYWDRIEKYVSEHTTAQFSHGMCPECFREHVEPELGIVPIDAPDAASTPGDTPDAASTPGDAP